MIWFVVMADQRRSRSSADQVPVTLAALAHLGYRLGFERTAGDEIQGLTADPRAVVDAVCALSRWGDWRLGIGIGRVETPLPDSTRSARGPAYLTARAAIEQSSSSPTGLCLLSAETPARNAADTPTGTDTAGPTGYGKPHAAEAALWLLRTVLGRRTHEGWEVAELLDQGLTNRDVAARLGITPSAASQRARIAAVPVVTAGRILAADLLAAAAHDHERGATS